MDYDATAIPAAAPAEASITLSVSSCLMMWPQMVKWQDFHSL